MPDLIDSLMTLAFVGVWLMIGSELVGRHAREAKLRALAVQERGNWH